MTKPFSKPSAPPGEILKTPLERLFGHVLRPRRGGAILCVLLSSFAAFIAAPVGAQAQADAESFSEREINDAAGDFFAASSQGIGEIVERIFSESGRPNAYIAAEEIGGSFFFGLRYGEGRITFKDGRPSRQVYWQGPSVGFDIGAGATQTFALVYGLDDPDDLHQRFPGVAGNAFFIAGFSVTYYGLDDISIALIRSGVGLRLGVNAGYLNFTPDRRSNPF